MTAVESLEHLQVERAENGVVTVRLDDPECRNALSDRMTASWVALLAQLRTDRAVRAVVITGAGPDFSAGEQMTPSHQAWLAIQDLEVPTIAAINGAAEGAGLCLALAADLRYAADDATLSVPSTGRLVTGAQAVGLGLVNRTFPAADLLAEVTAIAGSLATCIPVQTRPVHLVGH